MSDEDEPTNVQLSDANSREFPKIPGLRGGFTKRFNRTFARWAKKRGVVTHSDFTYGKGHPLKTKL